MVDEVTPIETKSSLKEVTPIETKTSLNEEQPEATQDNNDSNFNDDDFPLNDDFSELSGN